MSWNNGQSLVSPGLSITESLRPKVYPSQKAYHHRVHQSHPIYHSHSIIVFTPESVDDRVYHNKVGYIYCALHTTECR
jgi:hypothetical protein